MEGIVLALETQYLMKDVMGLWFYNNQGDMVFWGGINAHRRLVKMGWPLWSAFDNIIREKGPTQLTPWMKTKVDFPITSVRNAVKVARKCGGDGNVYYSWARRFPCNT